MNVAATWSTRLMKSRGLAMGQEHAGKGVDMQLGPVAGPLGRVPEGGRNWEGLFSSLICEDSCCSRIGRLQS
jgi:beta-glucosidase-like glycosyl hydrolase